MSDVKKVVLAYSGGLDTSVIVKWLQETYNCEVVTFTADIGQGEEGGTRGDTCESDPQARQSEEGEGRGAGCIGRGCAWRTGRAENPVGGAREVRPGDRE